MNISDFLSKRKTGAFFFVIHIFVHISFLRVSEINETTVMVFWPLSREISEHVKPEKVINVH